MIGLPSLRDVLAPHNGAELARRAGTTRTTIHRFKTGATLPDSTMIVGLADAVGIDLATMMFVVERDAKRTL